MDEFDEFISRIKDEAPESLRSVVYIAKQLNKERGAADTYEETITSLMAVLGALIRLPEHDLKPVRRRNRHLEMMERDASEYLQSINEVNTNIRAAIEEYKGLLRKVKDAKKEVVEEYRDVLGQFKEIMETADQDGSSRSTASTHANTQFQNILEDVIREVILDSEAIPVEDEEKNQFEELFEDQQLLDAFEDMFAGDSVDPRDLERQQEHPLPPGDPMPDHPPPTPIAPPAIVITTSGPPALPRLRRRDAASPVNNRPAAAAAAAATTAGGGQRPRRVELNLS